MRYNKQTIDFKRSAFKATKLFYLHSFAFI